MKSDHPDLNEFEAVCPEESFMGGDIDEKISDKTTDELVADVQEAIEALWGLAEGEGYSEVSYRQTLTDFSELARRVKESKMVRDPGYELPDAGLNSRKW